MRVSHSPSPQSDLQRSYSETLLYKSQASLRPWVIQLRRNLPSSFESSESRPWLSCKSEGRVFPAQSTPQSCDQLWSSCLFWDQNRLPRLDSRIFFSIFSPEFSCSSVSSRRWNLSARSHQPEQWNTSAERNWRYFYFWCWRLNAGWGDNCHIGVKSSHPHYNIWYGQIYKPT